MLRKKRIKSVLALFMGVAVLSICCLGVRMEAFAEEPVKVYCSGYFHQSGWSRDFQDNTLMRAQGGRYMTAVRAGLVNQPEGVTGTVSYQVNLSGSGWLDWGENMAEIGGAQGELPLESVRFKLTGQLAAQYDIYYSVFQNGEWTAWAMNEAAAGVEGAGLRVDGLKVSVVPKGTGEPPAVPGRVIDPSRPMVALTFDDGPNGPVTNRILDSLESNGGRATFFMVGNRVPGNAAVVRRMADMGCEVGNHTYEHRYLTSLGDAGIRTQVGLTNQRIAEACGVSPVLMHDLYGTTADAAEQIIPELTARGYQLVTVSEMAAFRGGMAPGHVYSQFRR